MSVGAGDGAIAAGVAPELIAEQQREPALVGLSPGRIALRRLRRNRGALLAGGVFLLLVAACLAAPLWSSIANRGPDEQPTGTETVEKGGEDVLILGLDGVPVGPTLHSEYLLGADSSGRDVLVRLLYGGRNSLLIGLSAALITTIFSMVVGLLSGYLRGFTDLALTNAMDVIWAFPVILLGIALGVAFAQDGINFFGIFTVPGGSLLIPILVIAVVYVPYMARPIRGEVLALREKEFVEAARAQGMGSLRIMFREILPNVITLVLVFFPLIVANAILLESALSFLGAGVQPPSPSWGTMLDDGVSRIITAPFLAIIPGAMVVITVLTLNVFGDGVREALDPRAKLMVQG